MARGPARNPSLLRYDEPGYVSGVYVVEAGSGVVKVGQAMSLTCRLRALHQDNKRRGIELGRFHVFRIQSWDLHSAERDAIRALNGAATRCVPAREYFAGVTFDEAVGIVRCAIHPLTLHH